VHLVALHDGSALFLDSVETSRALRIGSRVGRVMPAHCTAGGKALLAQLPPDAVRRLYGGGALERRTPRSLGSVADLEAELAEIRERGFATNFGQSEPDVAAVAVAVVGHPDRAAITVSAPITRLAEGDAPRIAQAAGRAAAELERRSLGGS
jgi:DNA-binding IclR family transcriptional regulator